MDIKDLSPEMQERIAGMRPEEIVELAKAEGVELTDEQLEAIAGGSLWGHAAPNYVECIGCGKEVAWPNDQEPPSMCPYCGRKFFL